MSNRHTNSRTGSSPPPPAGANHTPSAVSRSHGGSNVPSQKTHVTPDRPLSSDRPHAPVHNNTLSPTDKSALKSIERKTPRPDSRAVEELDNTLSADRHQAARAAEDIEVGPQDEWDEMLGQEMQGDLLIDAAPPEFLERLRKDQLIAINDEASNPTATRAIGASGAKRGTANASAAKHVPKPVAEKPIVSLGPETNARSGAGNPIFAHPGVESPMNGLFSQPPTPAPASATPASRTSALHLFDDVNQSGPVAKGTVSPLMLQSGIMNINIQPQRGISTPQQYTVHSPALLPVTASAPATVGGNRLLPVATMELIQGEMASPAMHGIQLGSGTPKSGKARVHHDPAAISVKHHPAPSGYARSSAASATGGVRRPQARAARPSSETSSGTAESGLSTRTQPSQIGVPVLTEEEIRRRNPTQSRKKMVPSEGSAFKEGRTGSEASSVTSPTRSGMSRANTFS